MGRFGNVLLVNGEPQLSLAVRQGEVLRFYLTDTANTRVFNLGLRGARMKRRRWRQRPLRAGGVRRERVVAPSERAVVDVLFDRAGQLDPRAPHAQAGRIAVATITVTDQQVRAVTASQFGSLRTNLEMVAERERVAHVPGPRSRTRRCPGRRDGHG